MIINITNMHSFGDIYEFYVFLVKNVLHIYVNYLKTYIGYYYYIFFNLVVFFKVRILQQCQCFQISSKVTKHIWEF